MVDLGACCTVFMIDFPNFLWPSGSWGLPKISGRSPLEAFSKLGFFCIHLVREAAPAAVREVKVTRAGGTFRGISQVPMNEPQGLALERGTEGNR